MTAHKSDKPAADQPGKKPAAEEREQRPAADQPRKKRMEFDLREIGFTLTTDDKTLAEIEEIQADAVKAAQAIRKFAWR